MSWFDEVSKKSKIRNWRGFLHESHERGIILVKKQFQQLIDLRKFCISKRPALAIRRQIKTQRSLIRLGTNMQEMRFILVMKSDARTTNLIPVVVTLI